MFSTSSLSVFDALSVIADFEDALANECLNTDERRNLIHQHLKKMDQLNFTVPQFKQGLDWLNVYEPLSWDNALKGQLVVLDFFTYCCVNCIHILPDLKALEMENANGSGIAVVGVHSAKFANEKVTANILSAVLRYGIKHPVVNDSEANLWQELSISCWPTLIFVGPSNQLLYTLVGEGHLAEMMEFVNIAKEYYTSLGQLIPKPLPIYLEEDKVKKSVLSFPGKIFFWKEWDWLVISDTGNHRIIITDKNGVVQETVGSGLCGFKDGSLMESEFSSPQGVACLKHKIYLADTGNHAIRLIDMLTKSVSTIMGTGKQGSDREGGKLATEQDIASPWDIALGHSQKNNKIDPDLLYIAMAGIHQIWVYFLEDTLWYKGRSYNKGTCVRFAGSGAEENRNNSYPEKAGLAQPSGLALSSTKNVLYIADSESSSIRSINLTDGKVSAVVGAEKDPTNLFASGDVDGKGVNAKLQHPLGVALLSPEGPLLVADSYNHKLKMVYLDTNMCESMSFDTMSDQISESQVSGQFNEPGGLDIDQSHGTIYVADTNNHSIKVIDFKTKRNFVLPVIFPKEELRDDVDAGIRSQNKLQDLMPLPEITIPLSDTSVTISLPLHLGDKEHMNLEAPNSFKITSLNESPLPVGSLIPNFDHEGKLKNTELTLALKENYKSGSYIFQVAIQMYVCLDEGNVCLPARTMNFSQVVNVK